MMLQLLFYIMLAVVMIYCLLILQWTIAWFKKLQPVRNPLSGHSLKISVIIAARNEAVNILHCLHSLKEQSYADFEVIISDDFSEDNTCLIISEFITDHPELKHWRVVRPEPG